MSEPIAYFLTWTCYGTWLHGDERGSVDRAHKIADTPYLDQSKPRRGWETSLLQHTPTKMSSMKRKLVAMTIARHCEIRGWELHALNVRTNHVHVVVSCGDVPPEGAMTQFKAWCTRRLRESGLAADTQRFWTEHGSTRYLWKEDQLQSAIEYVTECQ